MLQNKQLREEIFQLEKLITTECSNINSEEEKHNREKLACQQQETMKIRQKGIRLMHENKQLKKMMKTIWNEK